MYMEVEHGLARTLTVIDIQAVGLGDTFLLGDFFSCK